MKILSTSHCVCMLFFWQRQQLRATAENTRYSTHFHSHSAFDTSYKFEVHRSPNTLTHFSYRLSLLASKSVSHAIGESLSRNAATHKLASSYNMNYDLSFLIICASSWIHMQPLYCCSHHEKDVFVSPEQLVPTCFTLFAAFYEKISSWQTK